MTFDMRGMEHYIINGPIPVNYAGLTGTTMGMQRQGWQLAVETCIMEYADAYRIRLAGKHPAMNLRMVSYPVMLDRYMMKVKQGSLLPCMEFMIYVAAEHINFRCQEENKPDFRAIDFSEPMLTEFKMSEFSLDECAFFRPMKEEADIYIPKDQLWTAEKHLQAILDLQKDKQKELRKKARKRKDSEDKFGKDEEKENIKLQLIAI